MRSAWGLAPVLLCQLVYSQGVVEIYPSPTSVTKGMNTVTWSVNGVNGGNAIYGTVTAAGLYTAPAVIPMANAVDVRATSTAQPTVYGGSSVTISQPTPWVWSTNPASFVTGTGRSTTLSGSGFIPQSVTVSASPLSANSALSGTTQFTAAVTGASNPAVTWTATAGTISPAGLYTAPAGMPASQVVTVRATSVADATKWAQATVTLQSGGGGGGNNGVDLTAGRFLEQAAFGPTPQELVNVHATGISGWLDNQFALAETPITMPAQSGSVQSMTLNRLAMAPDQLRQKMAWALGQFIVISMNKNIYPDEYVPYQQILSHDAFGNYRALLADIAMSPQMGKYLDLANSNKAGVGGGANENFARELMQLFTIGLSQLNLDGSLVLQNGQPIPTYAQPDIVQTAAALTGWTYPMAAGAQPKSNNWENFSQPVMETRQGNHDTSMKTLIVSQNNLRCVLPAGQTVQQDMNGVLDCVFNHPNTGPFVATRLIRGLVTSNPTPAYIQRIATVFNDNGTGVRGDLKAVLRAILTDTEARQDTAAPTAGRLKDPIYFIVSFVRAMNGAIVPATIIPWNFVAMGETVNQPASVFGYYSPLYHLPVNPALYGPEYQIYTPTESVEEANMLFQIIHQPSSDPSIDLSPFNAVAGNTSQLLDVLDQKLFYGRMPALMRTSLATAIDASSGNTQRVETALYLGALSGEYQTQF